MLVKISDIKIKKRIRNDIGDIEQLKESISKYGLFHPIIINNKNELISGFRRLESVKQLGWYEVEVKTVSDLSKIELLERELEENIVRKDFTDNELQEAYYRINKLQNPGFFLRLLNRIKQFFKRFIK